ncbi:H101 protein, partial [Irena cyanogastra]|nr:H101 protein [Irena cyanogastra]
MLETAPAAAPTVSAPTTKKPKKAASGRKACKPAGPSVTELITKAVSASKERKGLSLTALKKALAADGYDVEKNNSRIKLGLKSLVSKGTLVQTKGIGASGFSKLNKKPTAKPKKPGETKEKATKKKKPAAKPKKPEAKKPACAAKKAATVKKSPKKAKKLAARESQKLAAAKRPEKAAEAGHPKKSAKSPTKAKAVKAEATKPKAAKPKAVKAKKAVPKEK